ncbi:unnamed protein product, partial [Ixodes hexagonus]
SRRQRRPDIQLYVPRGRNLEPLQRAASSYVQEDSTGKRDSDQTRWSTEMKGPRVSTGEVLSSQNRVTGRSSTTQVETPDRPSTASVHAGISRNELEQQMAPLPGRLHEPSTDSGKRLSDHSEGKSPKPSINTAECASMQKKAVVSGQRDVLGGAKSSKSVPLLPEQTGQKGSVTSKHSSVLEEPRQYSSKHLSGVVEQAQASNSVILTLPLSSGGTRSASDVQTALVQVNYRVGETLKLSAVPEDVSSKACSVGNQTASKVDQSLKPSVSSGGEGSSKGIHFLSVQAKSRSDKSSKPPVVSEDLPTSKLPAVQEELGSLEDIIPAMPVQVNSQRDEALRLFIVSEKSDSSKDLHCVTIERKPEPDCKLKPSALSEGPCSLKALPKSKSDEMLKSPVASEDGNESVDMNNASLENLSKSGGFGVSTVSEVHDSEEDIRDLPVQVKSKNDKILTPAVISGKDGTSQDSPALQVQNILKSNETLKPSTTPEEVSSLKDFRDVPELPNNSECTSQDLHGTSEQSKFESEELSTSTTLKKFKLSEELCALSEQVEDKIEDSLELPAATEDACSSRGAQGVPEQSQSEWSEALKPSSEVTSTHDSTSNSDEQDDQGNDSWDALFDESGECFDPGVLKDITEALGDIKVQHAELDYTKFEPRIPDLSEA